MCRLASLLQRFQLPRGASAMDLRQAYFREAKRLHPDRHPASARAMAEQEFVRLRADFDEALSLLGEQMPGTPGSGGPTQSPYEWTTGRTGVRWSTASWAQSSAASGDWEWRSSPPYARGGAEPAVPVVGLPQEVVYPVTSAVIFLASCYLVSLWLADEGAAARAAPSAAAMSPAAGGEAAEGLEPASASSGARALRGPVSRLRRALEGSPSSIGQRAAAVDLALQDEVVERLVLEDSTIGPAHAAAAKGRVWWLERCGAVGACREQLGWGDLRGDSPLHHCARHGQLTACRTLLRLGADPLHRNRWNLTPEHLAVHEGHGETASLLRAARRGDAVQQVARHPDGLGVMPLATDPLLRQGGRVFPGLRASESLRHAFNYAAGEEVLGPQALSAPSAAPGRLGAAFGGGGGGPSDEERAVARLREALRGRRYSLEAVETGSVRHAHEALSSGLVDRDGARRDLLGFLFFEPPGHVSRDAPGHWAALRHFPAEEPVAPAEPAAPAEPGGRGEEDGGTEPPEPPRTAVADASERGAGGEAGGGRILRLDPVRGPFELSATEASELLQRYRSWRIVALAEDAAGPS